MNKKYPNYIMIYLRRLNRLNDNDTSMDEFLNNLDPFTVFENVLKYNGLTNNGLAFEIKTWIKDIYGIELKQ